MLLNIHVVTGRFIACYKIQSLAKKDTVCLVTSQTPFIEEFQLLYGKLTKMNCMWVEFQATVLSNHGR
jgi:hypothetical protein